MGQGVGIADVAVLLTAAGTATYVLGVIAVAWPIHTRITNSAILTWHAVALIPKTVVAGQGVRMLFSFPAVVTVVTMVWLVLLAFYLSIVYALFDSLVVSTVLVLIPLLVSYPLFRKFYGSASISWLLGPTAVNPVSKSLRQ